MTHNPLFDRAVSEGVDSGRYALVVDPGASESRIAKGPRFGDDASRTEDPGLIHIQIWLDALLDSQDKQR